MKFLIGKKQEMSQKFLEDGTIVPVTRIIAGPCYVTQKKEYDGGRAIQLAWGEMKDSKLNNAQKGFFSKIFNRGGGYRHLKEFRLPEGDAMYDKLEAGQELGASIFEAGDEVDIQGISKGKGFQGVVRRHGFKGGKKSHGHKDQLRMPGSIGCKGPARVFKGTRMGGQMGNQTATVQGLEVIEINAENNEILVKGAVPGARNGLLFIVADGAFEPIKPEIKIVEEVKIEADKIDIKEEVKEVKEVGQEKAPETVEQEIKTAE